MSPSLALNIALKHLLARKRQSIVSLLGIVLGVAFFLAISSLMKGSENDFIRRLVDNSPHITLKDEYRNPRIQPVQSLYKGGAVEIHHITPLPENRGIRGYQKILQAIAAMDSIRASPVLSGQGILTYAAQDIGMTLNGMQPEDMASVTTLGNNMVEGSIANLITDPDGIIVGAGLTRKYGIGLNDTLRIGAGNGIVRSFKVVGIFKTGRESYDTSQAFVDLTRAQILLNRPNRVNSIIMKLADPTLAQTVADRIEQAARYKAVSWQESSADIMNTLAIRNTIMYTVVSAVLLVAAFGIYNVISTVVMEKQRDIAILKSMGFEPKDIKAIFLWQGLILGITGAGVGLPLGCLFMLGLMQIRMRVPGSSEAVQMPLDWGLTQFLIAAGFALTASMLAAYLPARRGAMVQPVDVIRGGM